MDFSNNLFETISQRSFQHASGWEPGFKRSLNLANCRISSIESPSLENIPGINDLDLSGNPGIPVANLTSVIKELETKGLEKLSLASLNLTTLRPFFTQVTQLSLKSLNASNNKIEEIGANTFSTVSSIRILDVSGNKFTSLDAGFSDLRNLRVLNISSNGMTSFQGEDIVSNLNKLKFLDLSGNNLADAAQVTFTPLTKLVSLDVSNNLLTTVILPESTPRLKHFDYHSNGITQFSGFDSVPKLEFFDMSDNDLKKVEGYLFKESRFLKMVNFSRNDISELDHNAFLPQSSLVIDLSHNFLKKAQYSNWVATQQLYLNHNEIEELDIQTFRLMNGLRVLDLSENKLSHLNEDLLDYTSSLVYLNLSHNAVQQTNFFLLFRNLENVEILDMGNNNVSHLNESMFVPLPNLKRFSLSQNHLEVIKPRVFRDLKHVTDIDLSGNPFVCGCDNLAFQDWISRTKIEITGLYSPNSSAYVCKGPGHRVGAHLTEWTPDQFECDKTMLYMIIFGSVGLTLIVAGIVSTVLYRLYKCHKRRQLEKEKAAFRADCYGDDDVYDKKNKGGKLDLGKMTTEEIAEEITNAIERRERRSMRKAEEMKKKNSNGYVPWPPSGKSDNNKTTKNKSEGKANEKPDKKNDNKARRGSLEARQYDRIMQQNEEIRRYSTADMGGKRDNRDRDGRRPEAERYATKEEDMIKATKALKVHRSTAVQQQGTSSSQRWKQVGRDGYGILEPESDYGYETEPAPHRRSTGQHRYNHSRWDGVDAWDRDARGWVIQGQGQGQRRSRSQGHRRDGYMTLPISEQDYRASNRGRSSRRGDHSRLYLDHYTNEVRFGVEDLHRYPTEENAMRTNKPSSSRHSRWDLHHHQQQQQQQQQQQLRRHQQQLRSRSFHHLPQEYDHPNRMSERDRTLRYHDDNNRQYHNYNNNNNNAGMNYRRDDDRRPLIGPRAASQPYLVSENTSDWL